MRIDGKRAVPGARADPWRGPDALQRSIRCDTPPSRASAPARSWGSMNSLSTSRQQQSNSGGAWHGRMRARFTTRRTAPARRRPRRACIQHATAGPTRQRGGDLACSGARLERHASGGLQADPSIPLLQPRRGGARCKQAVAAQCGLTVSVGVACTKAVAKLVSGLRKPDGLSALPQAGAAAFLAPLDCRVLPGVGGASRASSGRLASGISASSRPRRPRGSRARSPSPPAAALSGRNASSTSRGCDREAVVASGPPKTISVEDSFEARRASTR